MICALVYRGLGLLKGVENGILSQVHLWGKLGCVCLGPWKKSPSVFARLEMWFWYRDLGDKFNHPSVEKGSWGFSSGKCTVDRKHPKGITKVIL